MNLMYRLYSKGEQQDKLNDCLNGSHVQVDLVEGQETDGRMIWKAGSERMERISCQ